MKMNNERMKRNLTTFKKRIVVSCVCFPICVFDICCPCFQLKIMILWICSTSICFLNIYRGTLEFLHFRKDAQRNYMQNAHIDAPRSLIWSRFVPKSLFWKCTGGRATRRRHRISCAAQSPIPLHPGMK